MAHNNNHLMVISVNNIKNMPEKLQKSHDRKKGKMRNCFEEIVIEMYIENLEHKYTIVNRGR